MRRTSKLDHSLKIRISLEMEAALARVAETNVSNPSQAARQALVEFLRSDHTLPPQPPFEARSGVAPPQSKARDEHPRAKFSARIGQKGRYWPVISLISDFAESEPSEPCMPVPPEDIGAILPEERKPGD